MDVVAYDVPAWGVGELYLRAGKLLYHELPRMGSSNADRAEHPLAERVLAYFRGERVTFEDVEVEEEWATPDECRITAPDLSIRVKILERTHRPLSTLATLELTLPADVRIVKGSRK